VSGGDFDQLAAWQSDRRAELDRLFEARLAPPADGDPGRLLEAMRYSLLAPGKRIRPLLALAAAETVAAADGDVLLACGAVELVHCYSLIHDDLPAMDDDDFRRGRPSNHKAFGEGTAILAGDALLTLAFDWIAEAGERAARPQQFLAASRALARAAGAFGMVRGQARDLGEPPPTTLTALETLHAEKTAALFRAALELGGCVGGATPEARAALARFGTAYGLAFQHLDDIADEEHTAHKTAAAARAGVLLDEACREVAPIGVRSERLVALADALRKALSGHR
jgi:geranylgeranyl diphosphate synthase, type II